MPHPVGLPHIFIDRSLGRIAVPRMLRAAGLDLTTLAERYGIPHDEDVDDVTWLTDTARLDWVAFMKDERIRRPAEKAAVVDNQARCLYLTRQDLPGVEMARRFLANIDAIVAACAECGPFIYAVQTARIDRIDLG